MNAFTTRLVDTVAAVAIVGTLLALLCLAAAVEWARDQVAARRLRVSRALLRSRVRPRPSDAALHDLRLPVSGLDVDGQDGAETDLAAFAEYGGVPFSEQVRR